MVCDAETHDPLFAGEKIEAQRGEEMFSGWVSSVSVAGSQAGCLVSNQGSKMEKRRGRPLPALSGASSVNPDSSRTPSEPILSTGRAQGCPPQGPIVRCLKSWVPGAQHGHQASLSPPGLYEVGLSCCYLEGKREQSHFLQRSCQCAELLRKKAGQGREVGPSISERRGSMMGGA